MNLKLYTLRSDHMLSAVLSERERRPALPGPARDNSDIWSDSRIESSAAVSVSAQDSSFTVKFTPRKAAASEISRAF